MSAAVPPESRHLVLELHKVAVDAVSDPGRPVLEEIDWTVAAGDYWVVAGLQGSGKSDLLMMMASLVAPLRGRYSFFGEQMPIFDEERLAHRLRLGLVFDGGQLFNHLTVWENVALPLRYHRNLTRAAAAAQVDALLELTELGPWAASTPGAMGRIWQKRVGLARALALEPEVLLVDNPLAGLDLPHTHWWLTFLGKLSRGEHLSFGRPMTLIVTAAELRPWRNQARQFALLKDKRFSVIGGWSELECASRELLTELLSAEPTVN